MSAGAGSCPNCGAAIAFRWSGAVQTTCSACRSILVRHDLDLDRVGVAADVPRAMSRIQLGTEGRFKHTPFVVVGRIVYRHARGHWSEWHIRLADDTSAWLSDAQGEYAVTRQVQLPSLRLRPQAPGRTILLSGREWTVANRTTASYVSVEGELPFEYWDRSELQFCDLKHGTDGFGTIDFSEDPPLIFLGEYESFEELRLTNLTEAGHDVRVEARSLSCPQCGAAIELHIGSLAQGVACAFCSAVLGVQDAGLAVLQTHENKVRAGRPLIPLGSTGGLKGVVWRAVGYQVRAIQVDEVEYAWREYLLWNTDHGFRYLTEYDGHWNDVTVLRGVPADSTDAAVTYHGQTFRHFQSARARTTFVLGEFPWEVRVGDQAQVDDYVAPPLMLSREATADEVTWSLGTYTNPQRIREAFGLTQPLSAPRGVYANQPNPHRGRARAYAGVFAVLAVALLVLFLGRRATARNESVFADAYTFRPGQAGSAQAFTTRPFELRGRPSNVEIRVDTDLSNNWAYFNLALLDAGGGRGFEVGREVSYYSGVSGGERWTEGSRGRRALLSGVPPGSYYLLVQVDPSGSRARFNYELQVRRDVPRIWPFVLGFVLLALPALFAWGHDNIFESTRWQESDTVPAGDDEDG